MLARLCIAALALLLATIAAGSPAPASGPSLARGHTPDGRALVSLTDGERVRAQLAGAAIWEGARAHEAPLAHDLTGDGRPDLVLRVWEGGAHGPTRLVAFQLEPTFRALGEVELGCSEEATLCDLDRDGAAEVVAHDWSLAGWRGCFADAPAPRVVYRLGPGDFRLARDLMRRPAPSADALAARAATLRADPAWAEGEAPAALWAEALEWTYAGQPAAADALIRAAWAATPQAREAFRADLQVAISHGALGAAELSVAAVPR